MPLRRKRRPDALTFKERNGIAKGLAAKLSLREIARRLSRSPSTVSREVRQLAKGLSGSRRESYPTARVPTQALQDDR